MPYDLPSYFVPAPIGGQRIDVQRSQVPDNAAAILNNYVQRNGRVVIRPGYQQQGGSLTNRVTGLISYGLDSGSQKIVVATSAGWFYWNPTTQAWVDITQAGNGLATSADDFQVFRVFYKNDVSYLVGCNGHSDAPIKWDGAASNYTDVGGSPRAAKTMVVLANRMIMGNFSGDPLQVDCSGFNDFETGWGSTQVTNLADTPGPIVAMQEMGSLVAAIYKVDAWYLATAVAATYPFTFTLKQAGISGPMSVASVVSTPRGHYILARDGNVYVCDGASYTAIGNHVRNAVLSSINMDKMHRSFGFYDELQNEIWFFWPGAGSANPNKGLVIRLDGTVWPISFPSSFLPSAGIQTLLETGLTIGAMLNPLSYYTNPLSSYTGRQILQMIGTQGGKTFKQYGYTDDGTAITGSYMSGLKSVSEERKFVLVGQSELYFKKVAGGSVTPYLQYSDSEVGAYTEITGSSKDLGIAGPYLMGSRVSSRFFGLRHTVQCAGGEVEYQGCRISGTERGRR